jgi:hypothetical protein
VGSSFAKVVAFTIVSKNAAFPTLNTRFFDHVLLVTCLHVGNSAEWITGWPGWIEAITVFKPGERMTMGQQGRTDGSHGSRPTFS